MSAGRRLPILALALSLVSCADLNTIHRNNSIGGNAPRVITGDAKQTHLLIFRRANEPRPSGGNGQLDTHWAVCAQAAPDVFSAFASSAAADIGIAADKASSDVKARAALAIAEAAGTIERTQTINLFRESMYRTCERYLSGAITGDDLVIQAGRDWKAMIAVLAIEQLTRTARPPATILVAPSTTANVTGTADIVSELSRTARAAEQAKIAKEAVDKDYETKQCATVPAKADGEAADVTQKRQDCDALKLRQDTAAEELRKAEAARTAIADAIAKSPAATAPPQAGATTGVSTGSSAGGTTDKPTGDVAAIAGVVGALATIALNTDDVTLICLRKLLPPPGTGAAADPDHDKCWGYLNQRRLFEDNLLQKAVGFAAGLTSASYQEPGQAARSAQLSTYLLNGSGSVQEKWASLLAKTKAFPPDTEKHLSSEGVDITSAVRIFENHNLDTQKLIIAAMQN